MDRSKLNQAPNAKTLNAHIGTAGVEMSGSTGASNGAALGRYGVFADTNDGLPIQHGGNSRRHWMNQGQHSDVLSVPLPSVAPRFPVLSSVNVLQLLSRLA